MRLVRDGFTHSEIAERLGIPIGTVKSRSAKAADTLRAELASLQGATMLSEQESRRPIPRPSTSSSATCPRPSEPSSTVISRLPLLPIRRRRVQRHRPDHQELPPHVEPPADLEDRTIAAMVAALAKRRAEPRPPPDTEDQDATRLHPRSPSLRLSPRLRSIRFPSSGLRPRPRPSSTHALDWPVDWPETRPADGHSPAGVAPLPRPSRRA